MRLNSPACEAPSELSAELLGLFLSGEVIGFPIFFFEVSNHPLHAPESRWGRNDDVGAAYFVLVSSPSGEYTTPSAVN